MNERDNTVLIDMDGVMANFDKSAVAHVPEHLIVARSHFYVTQDYPENIRPSIEEVYNNPGFFEQLEPMPGLFEAWQAMLDNGYEPRVASAPLSSNRNAIEGKLKWLDRVMVPEFGAGIIEDAIIDKNKWKYSGLALIDDRPTVERGPNGENRANWEHILFGWEHLQEVPMATAAFRLMSWQNPEPVIELLDQVREMKASRV